jgi:hypothetical protein
METHLTGFNNAWTRLWPGFRPIGYMLRTDGAGHWARFHSLPDAKRYAETDEERRLILSFQNTLAADVLGDAPCWLVQSQWTRPDLADDGDPFKAVRDYGLEFAFIFSELGAGPDDTQWRAHAGEMRWAEGEFDDLLLQIAEHAAGPTLWMSSTTGNIFAPYDGGVDLFIPLSERLSELSNTFQNRRSPHPAGL